MHTPYELTLAAIDERLYTNESDSIFMRWPTAEKELPRGNHTPEGLSDTCLHFMEDILTKSGRPNHLWGNFFFVHFGGWDHLIDYTRKDQKRRRYLLRCEEKGYSVSEDRQYFDRELVSTATVKGIVTPVPSMVMRCITQANVYLVRNFCGRYSDASRDTLCGEIRRFLETGSDDEKGLSPQMDPDDRYCLFMYIRSCLDQYEAARNAGEDDDTQSLHLGTALTWLLLAALLRDSCENLCSLIPSPSIRLLRVQVREAKESAVPTVAPCSLPPVPSRFLGREDELALISGHFENSAAPFWITGEGACGKTSLASVFCTRDKGLTGVCAVYGGDLRSTVASIRFRDTMPMDQADTGVLYRFNLQRLTRYGEQILLLIDNFDAPGYDKTFTELLSEPAGRDLTNADILEDLLRTGARLLFTTRTTPPAQYASLCLSDAKHQLPLKVLLALSESIYTDCGWSEYEEVLMSQIILAAGKHVMLVELLAAALQQQSGFSSLEEVLQKLKSLRLPGIDGDVSSRRHPASAASVYELMRGVFRFSSADSGSAQLLRQLSLLSPQGMDRDLFMEFSGAAGDKSGTLRRALLRLRDLHLVTIDPRTAHISMHPVLSDVAAADLRPDMHNCGDMIRRAASYYDPDSTAKYDMRRLAQVSAMCERAGKLLSGYDTAPPSSGKNRPVSAAEEAATGADALIPCAADAPVRLFLAASRIEYGLGNYSASLELAERALKENDRPAADSPLLSAAALKCGARSLAGLGLYDGAEEAYRRALLIVTDHLGPEHPKTAEIFNDLGVTLEEAGRIGEALDCLQKALGIQEKLFGPDSIEISSTCNNLGMVYADHGDLKSAHRLYRQSLDISLRFYGPEHPETAVSYGNLGELLLHVMQEEDTGSHREEAAKARLYLERALEIQTAAFGADYPANACTLNNLGLLEDLEENYVLARSQYKRALQIQSSVAGPEHPRCADILHNIAASYIYEDPESADMLDKALECERRAYTVSLHTLGASHPTTAMLSESVGWIRERLRDLKN